MKDIKFETRVQRMEEPRYTSIKNDVATNRVNETALNFLKVIAVAAFAVLVSWIFIKSFIGKKSCIIMLLNSRH